MQVLMNENKGILLERAMDLEIENTTRIVLLFLIRLIGSEGSIQKSVIADRAGFSEDTVRFHLKMLEDAGYLKIARIKGGRGLGNYYTVTLEKANHEG